MPTRYAGTHERRMNFDRIRRSFATTERAVAWAAKAGSTLPNVRIPGRAPLTAAMLALATCVAGCGNNAAPLPPPTARPTATMTLTPVVNFVVHVTSIAQTVHATPRPTAAPTPFVTPVGVPYLQIVPSRGPPVSTTINIAGGNLPPSSPVTLTWAAQSDFAPISRAVRTDHKGQLHTTFRVPASPLGYYTVAASVDGGTLASAKFDVTSRASIRVGTSLTTKGLVIAIQGRRFVPHLNVVLIATSLGPRATQVILGNAITNAHGTFIVRKLNRALAAGQYVLRAWSTSAGSAQMAEYFFEVST